MFGDRTSSCIGDWHARCRRQGADLTQTPLRQLRGSSFARLHLGATYENDVDFYIFLGWYDLFNSVCFHESIREIFTYRFFIVLSS
jgi:hypothetical protein